tara:strand:- start:8827 stop:9666 length:840 start_codon:yes stop_codon:yes gene_type:complete
VDPENTISAGNLILFGIALFGAIASYSRPIRRLSEPEPTWSPWNLSIVAFSRYLWLVLLAILFAPLAGDTLIGLIIPSRADDDRIRSIFATFVMQAGLIGVVLVAIQNRKWSLHSFFETSGVSWKVVFTHTGHLFFRYLPAIWLVGAFWGTILYALNYLGFPITAEPQIATQWIAESSSITFLAVMGIMVVLTAPLSEELVFRGLLFRFLRERSSARFALILSSLLFALLHASLHSFLPLLFIGLLLTKLYDDTRDIRTPILFHLFFNLFSFLNLLLFP